MISKEKQHEYSQRYYWKHKKKISERRKEYDHKRYLNNRDKILSDLNRKERVHQYYIAHRENWRKKGKIYYENNKEKEIERRKKYADSHPDQKNS